MQDPNIFPQNSGQTFPPRETSNPGSHHVRRHGMSRSESEAPPKQRARLDTPQRPSRQPRWRWTGDNPQNNWSQLPKGWNPDEPDLDPRDLDARIDRCKERIEDNYMTYLFEEQLRVLQQAKRERRMMTAPYQEFGLDLDTIERLESLRIVKEALEKQGDPHQELLNVKAIMAAYKSRHLKLNAKGLVTYWSYGKQLCDPREFSWDEFRQWNKKYTGDKGFWVEGRDGPDPLPLCAMTRRCPSMAGNKSYSLSFLVRLGPPLATNGARDGALPELELDFMDDTGAAATCIFHDDMIKLMGQDPDGEHDHAPFKQVLGYSAVRNADGSRRAMLCVYAEVNMYNASRGVTGRRLMVEKWVPVGLFVDVRNSEGPNGPRERLSGRWFRHVLFTATAPETAQDMYISTHKSGLTEKKALPSIKREDVKPPPLVRRNAGAVIREVLDTETGQSHSEVRPDPTQKGRLPEDKTTLKTVSRTPTPPAQQRGQGS
ncbi:hypothetical protein N7492_003460 [Penicillium capsulatum]|uniref:Uncharacterized protein n=1 Tax=Penicillium capsulatum TaxID=69766 RepID=A0A9W9LWL4_9EURO|nr:hypothetical protein N7492_003460 [Penicillium capsulatum]KAJ6121957.1 hypothetical protein N7512_004422 [Penicillium capsulatum]